MLKKLSYVDWLFALVVLAMVVLLAFSIYYKPTISGKNTLLTIRVTSDVASIDSAISSQPSVYINSSNTPVSFVSTVKLDGNTYITVRSPGSIEAGRLIFNGNRVLLGQKVELHSTYFAQGYITEVKYE